MRRDRIVRLGCEFKSEAKAKTNTVSKKQKGRLNFMNKNENLWQQGKQKN